MAKVKKFRDTNKDAPIWQRRINELVEEKGWNQKEFAEALGVSPSSVSGWIGLNKKLDTIRVPRMGILLDIASCLGVSVHYILGSDDCKTPADEEIHRITGLSDLAIKRLKKGQQLIDKGNLSAEKKMYVMNYLIEEIGNSALLEDLYDYLFGNYHLKNDKRAENQGAEVVVTKTPSGKDKQVVVFNEVYSQASFADVQSDLVRMKDKISKKREGAK